jgi:hypothetical protein
MDLRKAARMAQTKKRQWPSARLAQSRSARIHLALNGKHKQQLHATNQALFLTFASIRLQEMISEP